ncbi:LysR family transcriptional regulator [Candidatus Odyssella acanthamoebae]|uniref:LysR family transcriptional regulator n=1 Tax=Candidatus Odyssella acanthamoebae TaxID=91604 RepID=UPI00094AA822|nr:LysR family transcriptional regulator [Candidatus Paracaedibacter acanthamoebae]
MRPIDLSKLRPFYMVAREGSMTKAAAKLNVSQPSLSVLISDLEYNLKTQLFKRFPAGMRLTAQGERLYAFAEKMLQQADNFERVFYEKEGEAEGEIKIITTPFVGSEWLVPSLDDFLNKYPDIRTKIFLTTDNININEGDVAICTFIPHQPHLIQKPLFNARIRLFASPSYLKKYGTPHTPEDLDDHHLITYKDNYYTSHGSTNWVLNLGIKKGSGPRHPYFEINSLHGMFNAALKGYGIVELPDYPIITESKLVEVLPDIQGEFIPLYYSFLENRRFSKKISLLFNYLAKKSKAVSMEG